MWVATDDRFPGSTRGACLILKQFGVDAVLAQPFPRLMIFSKDKRFEVRGDYLAEKTIRSVKSAKDGGFQITETFATRRRLFSKRQGFGTRRDCDVLPAARFKYYYSFAGIGNEYVAEGICFFTKDGTRIVNFPDQHADNCVRKQKDTKDCFKPTVRVYKNMRNYMVDKATLADGIAPSYFIEGMLYNVPTDKFGKSFDDTFVATFNYITAADRTAFKCANEIHPLLQDNSHTSWPAGNCQTFLNALRSLWNNWK